MAGILSPVTLTTAGTRQPLVAAATYVVGGMQMPTLRYCNRCSVRLEDPTKTGYIGLQPSGGVSNTVSSTVYNVLLNSATPAFTIGPFGDGNDVDLGSTYVDGDTSGMKFILSPVQV